MPVVVNQHGDILHIRFSGVLGCEDLAELRHIVPKIEAELERAPDRIVHTDDVETFRLSFAILSEVVSIRKAMVLKNNITTVLVAKRNIAYGISRMFQTLNSHPQIKVIVTRSREEALALLSSPAEADHSRD